jgi:Cu(I)/Ag(I) efflux system membrane fusion protein
VGLLASATALLLWTRPGSDPPRATGPAVAAVPPAREEAAPIRLEPGAATAVVAEREMLRVISARGAVTFHEDRTHHVRSPVAGILVKTRASSLGRQIRAGETLGVVYSLEVYFATVDLLSQLRDFTGQELLDRERLRLLRWGMRQQQITRIEQAMRPAAALPLIARETGTVVVERGGARLLIDPWSDVVMTITDPTYASIYVSVPAADAELLAVGRPTRVTLANQAKPMTAPIGYISRAVTSGMKTVRVDLHPVRLAMPPQVDATIELARTRVRGPAVPEGAVVRDVGRTLVYVVRGSVAQPRAVRLRPGGEGYALVEDGLAIGETVLVHH